MTKQFMDGQEALQRCKMAKISCNRSMKWLEILSESIEGTGPGDPPLTACELAIIAEIEATAARILACEGD
jgi:hypothetical protein